MSGTVAKISSEEELWFKYGENGPLGLYDIDTGALGPGPHSALEKARCDRYYFLVWQVTLTEQEKDLLPSWPDLPDGLLSRSMNHKLDRKIMEMADVDGMPFIAYSRYFRRRMAAWKKDPNGGRLAREFGEALAHGVEVEQDEPYNGEARKIFQEPHDYLFRERAAIEWPLMRERIKSFLAENPHAKLKELWPFIESEAKTNPKTFRLLGVRLSFLKNFLSYQESRGTLGESLRWRIDGFVNQWMSYNSGREAVSLRNDIRNMGKRLKGEV